MHSLNYIIKQNQKAQQQGVSGVDTAVGNRTETREYGTVFDSNGNVVDQGLTRVEALHQYGPNAVWVKN